MLISRLRPLIDLPRRARDAPPSGGRDARRVAGLQSPLFNRDVHPSELLATLYFVRLRLIDDAVPRRLHAQELEA
jgi:hypothetical protein